MDNKFNYEANGTRLGYTDQKGISSNYSGGDFITTACVRYKGLTDDCMELNTLRNFRDNYMLKSLEKAVDIVEYYKNGPAMVEAIDSKSDDKNSVYEYIYSVVDNCIYFIKKGDNEKSYELYKEMYSTLKKKFL